MSFFLWSSIPDDELRRAAAAGELTNPAVLAKQVKRMTADPKARRFATEFFGQWLGFYRFDQYRGVDTGRFPEFTEDVKSAMYDEAVSTFEYIVRKTVRSARSSRRLHVPEHAAGEVLRHRAGREVSRQSGAGGRRQRAEPRRRAAARRRADDDLGAAADQSGQTWRLDPAPHPRDADAAAAARRGQHRGRRSDVPGLDPASEAGRSTSATPRAPIATCASTRSAFRWKRSTRSAGRATTYADGTPVDVTGEFADKTDDRRSRRSPAISAGTRQAGDDDVVEEDDRVRARTDRQGLRPAADRRHGESGRQAVGVRLGREIVTSRQFRNRAGGILAREGSMSRQ